MFNIAIMSEIPRNCLKLKILLVVVSSRLKEREKTFFDAFSNVIFKGIRTSFERIYSFSIFVGCVYRVNYQIANNL